MRVAEKKTDSETNESLSAFSTETLLINLLDSHFIHV